MTQLIQGIENCFRTEIKQRYSSGTHETIVYCSLNCGKQSERKPHYKIVCCRTQLTHGRYNITILRAAKLIVFRLTPSTDSSILAEILFQVLLTDMLSLSCCRVSLSRRSLAHIEHSAVLFCVGSKMFSRVSSLLRFLLSPSGTALPTHPCRFEDNATTPSRISVSLRRSSP